MSMSEETDSLAPGFLIAAPQLEGSPFERAVIMMVHHDDQGAMGFIINKPVEIGFGALIQSAEEVLGPDIAEDRFGETVLFGGPVQIEQLWLVYRDGADRDVHQPEIDDLGDIAEMRFESNWVIAGSGTTIEEFASGERDAPFHPIIGYAGWGPGQLEDEIESGSWLAVDFDEQLLLETEPEECWEAALDIVGLDPASFMLMGGGGTA